MHGVYGLQSFEILKNIICLATFNFNSCMPDDNGQHRISSSVSEFCVTSGCFGAGSRNSKDKAVDLDLFVSLLNNYSNYDVCLTSECFQIAADISSHLNQKNEPCDNFFRSTCEEFKVKYDSYHRHYVSPFTQVEDAIALQLKDLLEKELKEKEPDFIAMIKGLYNSCMDEKSIENEDSNPLRNVLKYLGGWPILEEEKWDKSSFDWIDTLIKMRNLGYNHNIFMGLSVKVDQRNKSSNILWLDQPSLGIDGKYLIRDANDSTKNTYRALMVKAMYQLKSNDTLFLKPAEDLKKHILHDTLDFESKIANLSLQVEKRQNVGNSNRRRMTIAKLMREIPEINWFKYIQGLANTEIKEYEYLIIDDLDFVKDLSHLIAQTDKSLIANYMIWRVVQESLPLLSKPWRTLNLRSKQEPEVSEWQPRWKQCLSYLKDTFEVAINSYYVRRYFPEENKQIAREIYDYIYIELLNAIDRSHWMDYETKIIARDKAYAIRPHIGYTNELLDDSIISKLYVGLNLTNEGYFDKALKVRKWSTNNYFSNVRKPNIGQDWKTHANATSIEYSYNNKDNSIEFPAGILQPIFFYKNGPKYLSFGALGSLIGHEITHGFDNKGRKYFKNGKRFDWWSDDSRKAFQTKTQCIIDQYNTYLNYRDPKNSADVMVDGNKTQVENLADSAGLKLAYLAYQTWVKLHGSELKLPGLKYNQNQLFWISAGRALCEEVNLDYIMKGGSNGEYFLPEARLNGQISNLEEFAKDFNCASDQFMNRKNKCQIW